MNLQQNKGETGTMNQTRSMSRYCGAAIAAIALSVIAWSNLQAQIPTAGPVTFSITMTVQNTNFTDNGTISTTPAPKRVTLANRDILKLLATDGLIPSPVPVGATLEVMNDGSGDTSFAVVQKTNSWDVSSVLTVTSGNNDVSYGRSADDPTGASSGTDYQIVTFTFDDTGSGGNTQFSLTGLATMTYNVTATSARTGMQTETDTFSMTSAAGEGSPDVADTVQAVLTGSVNASLKGSQ